MDPHLLGRRDQRDRRQADGDPRQVGRRLGLLARLGQVHQRRLLSQPQARRVLGHQQLRPPGAHLPFDHRRRRRQHLGLRRDDQQLHRHPQRQDHDHHGRQSGRGASGVAAARAGRQGDAARQHDRHRSAHDPHRGARHRICPHPLRHRHPGDLRACCGTSSRTAGKTSSSSNSASTAWTTSARKSRKYTPEEVERISGVPGAQLERVAKMFATEKPVDPDLVHGRDPAHRRHRQRARVLHRAARHRQRRRARHRRQHLPRPHQRAGRDRPRPRYRDAAALLRPRRRRVAALVARLGGRLPVVRRPLRQDHRRRRQRNQHDEHAGHPVDPLVRRDALRQEGRHAEGQHQGDVRHGPRRQHRDPHAAGAEGHRGARSAGGRRSASDHLGGAGAGAQEQHLSAADRDQLRDRGLAHRRPTARSSGASRSSSRSSSPRTTTR